MATLTITQLRSLVRMYRRGVEGAAEQLRELVQWRPDVVSSLLQVPAEEFAKLMLKDDTADAAATLLEQGDAERRGNAKRDALASARELGDTLSRMADWQGHEVHLNSVAFRSLIATRARGELVFAVADDDNPGDNPGNNTERLGALNLGYLRALFRECRACRLTALFIEGDYMHIVYSAQGARGRFRLLLAPPDPRQAHVGVRLVKHRAERGLLDSWIPGAERSPDVLLPVARRVLDALSAEVGR